MTCPTCGGSGGGLASHACVEALAERMAKLEAIPIIAAYFASPDAQQRDSTEDRLSQLEKWIPQCTTTSFEELVAKVGPLASGLVASAGEPPPPAAGTLSDDYEDCRKCADRRQHVAALEAQLAQAERAHRDALKLASSQRELIAQAEEARELLAKFATERGRQVEQMAEHVATMRVERDEAIRQRDIANGVREQYHREREGIRSGKPAPGTDNG